MNNSGANTRSKLLCPFCGVVQPVEEIDEDGLLRLSCGHWRGQLLPVHEGHLSLEHLRTNAGQKAFPANRDGELTTLPAFDEWLGA